MAEPPPLPSPSMPPPVPNTPKRVQSLGIAKPLIIVSVIGVIGLGLVVSVSRRSSEQTVVEQPRQQTKIPDAVRQAREAEMRKNKIAGEEENRKIQAMGEAIRTSTVVPTEANRVTFVKFAQSMMTDRIVSSTGPSNTVFELRVPDTLTDETIKAFPHAFANALPEIFQAEISLGFQAIAVTDATGKRRIWTLPSIAADSRRSYAKNFEKDMLSQGFSVDIATAGTGSTTLIIKWILTTKAQAYQIANDKTLTKAWKDVGFKKIEITDGYNENWIVTLTK